MDYVFTAWCVVLALLGFGFVIFIHELGHFLFAKWAGVRVDRFSIGFGPILFRKQIGETEYAISLLPLGGYVKMLGQEDTPTAIDEKAKVDAKSFLAKSRLWQAAILLGGVLFNLISSYIILVLLSWYGMPVLPPVVGDIRPEMAAANGEMLASPAVKLGLRQGDRILAVNEVRTRSFEDVMLGVISAGNQPVTLKVERSGKILNLPEDGSRVIPAFMAERGIQGLGFEVAKGWRLMDVARADGPLRPEDPQLYERVVAIAGQALPAGLAGQQVEDRLAAHFGQPVNVTLEHQGVTREVSLRYAGSSHPGLLALGLPVRLERVLAKSPAERAGLKPGDVIETINGEAVSSAAHFLARTHVANASGQSMTLVVRRGSESVTAVVTGEDSRGRRLMGVVPENLLGVLPFLPKQPDGQPGPLETAGLKPGDAVVTFNPGKNLGLELDVVSGAEATVISLPGYTGERQPTGNELKIIDQLCGSRIDNTGDGLGFPGKDQIRILLENGKAKTLDLVSLPETVRNSLFAGLKPGDRILGLRPDAATAVLALELVRGGTARTVSMPARDVGVALMFGRETEPYHLAAWTEAFSVANDAAVQMVDTTLRFIPRFFKKAEAGGIDPNKALTGPIGIFNLLRKSVEIEGYAYFLKWIAIIGLNLFLINLLPIPITDGGQLAMMGIEAVIRRPLPDRARAFFMWVGLVLVVALMLYVIGLDVLRLFGVL